MYLAHGSQECTLKSRNNKIAINVKLKASSNKQNVYFVYQFSCILYQSVLYEKPQVLIKMFIDAGTFFNWYIL